ncbi:beta-lactamase superfamily domain-containing protein [Amylocarpus encephaloides]|uniref:Beta-lactamase superfamily domain-containing protein n=1 Tax=Amylocarpus encephaloides TaxID=45428 RepID=A0A9P7YFX8_9HELO|nr:beta-lactamase superfamily domain-containing protein [Amylocarpus encephaloides]
MSPSSASFIRPAHHANESGTLFRNPWPSAEKPTWAEMSTVRNPLSWYNSHELKKHKRAKEIEVVQLDWGVSSLKSRGLKKEKCVIGTWLGHAGAMVEIPLHGFPKNQEEKSLWVLFDPIFSTRAGPMQYIGPGRLKDSPCQVSDFLACDAVAISHNHYDHLDLSSIKAVSKKFPKCKYFVPLGNKSWFSSIGVPAELIFELDWWEDREFSLHDWGYHVKQENVEAKMRFTCVPAQHNTGRGTLDQGTTLWCGWIVEQLLSPKEKQPGDLTTDTKRIGAIYHAGDTGYRRSAKSEEICPAFKEIGQKFGPFDLSFLPLWRGGTLGFVSSIGLRLSHHDIPQTFHASPTDAIAIHQDVKSKNSIGVHFGTFIGSENESYEAVIEFDEAREKQGLLDLNDLNESENGRSGTLDIGGSIAIEIT